MVVIKKGWHQTSGEAVGSPTQDPCNAVPFKKVNRSLQVKGRSVCTQIGLNKHVSAEEEKGQI